MTARDDLHAFFEKAVAAGDEPGVRYIEALAADIDAHNPNRPPLLDEIRRNHHTEGHAMTSAEYREKAEKLLTTRTVGGDLAEGAVGQATAWALLANAAATEELAKVVRCGE